MSIPREPDPGREVHDALKAQPDCLQPRIAVALAAQDPAEFGDEAQNLIEPERLCRSTRANVI